MPHSSPHSSRRSRAAGLATSLTLLLALPGLWACGGSSGGSGSNSTATAHAAASATTTGSGATTTGSSGATTSGSPGATTSGSPGATTGAPPASAPAGPGRFTAVRECLRKKGITPPAGGARGLLAGAPPKGMTRAQYTEALRSCSAGLAPGGLKARTRFGQRFRQVLVRFAECLRQNGANVGQPNTSGSGPIFNVKGLNTGSPQFRAAAVKCRRTLFAGRAPRAGSG